MSDKLEFTPEVAAAFDAAVAPSDQVEQTVVAEEAAPVVEEVQEPVTVVEPQQDSVLDRLKKKLGDQGNELGELRKWKQEQDAAKAQDPATEEARFEQWMQRWDPDFKDLKDADGYVRDRTVLYNMAQDMFAYVHNVREQLVSEIGGLKTQSELERQGITEEALSKIVSDPVLGGLWEKASREERVVLAQKLAAPSVQGPSAPQPSRASVPDPSVSGIPNSGRASGEEMALRAISSGKLSEATNYIDDILDRSLVGVQGAVIGGQARRR